MKKNTRLNFLSVVYLIGLHFNSHGFIEIISAHKNDTHVVACLGERHKAWYKAGEQCAEFEDRDKKLLLGFVEHISQSCTPIHVILESQSKDIPAFRGLLQEEYDGMRPGCLSTLSAFAAQHENHYGAIKFIWSDNRGPVNMTINQAFGYFSNPKFYKSFCSQYLVDFSCELKKLASEKVEVVTALQALQKMGNTDAFDQLINACPELKKLFFEKNGIFDKLQTECYRELSRYTGNDLIAEIDKDLVRLTRLLKEYEGNKPLKNIFQAYSEKLSLIKTQVKDFFMTVGGLETLCSVSAFHAAKNISFAYVRDQMYLWLIPLGGITADMFFINELAIAAQQGHHVVFYGGANHAIELTKVCREINMSNVCHHGLQEKMDKAGQIIRPKSQFDNASLESIFHFVATALVSEPNRKSVCAAAATHSCGYCKKKGVGFKRCSRCQSVYYCSVQCQSSDWLEHMSRCIKKSVLS